MMNGITAALENNLRSSDDGVGIDGIQVSRERAKTTPSICDAIRRSIGVTTFTAAKTNLVTHWGI